jgi:hypothetical protein
VKLSCLSLTALALVAVTLALTGGESEPRIDSLSTVRTPEPLDDGEGLRAVSWSDLMPPTEPHPEAIVISPGPDLCFVDRAEMEYPTAMTYLREHQHEIVAVHLVLWKANTKGNQLVFDWLDQTGIQYSVGHHEGNVVVPTDEELRSEFVGN